MGLKAETPLAARGGFGTALLGPGRIGGAGGIRIAFGLAVRVAPSPDSGGIRRHLLPKAGQPLRELASELVETSFHLLDAVQSNVSENSGENGAAGQFAGEATDGAQSRIVMQATKQSAGVGDVQGIGGQMGAEDGPAREGRASGTVRPFNHRQDGGEVNLI
jgi:hypothetical protein